MLKDGNYVLLYILGRLSSIGDLFKHRQGVFQNVKTPLAAAISYSS
jgi:hypothetical protein